MGSKDKNRWPEFLDRFILSGILLSLLFWLIESVMDPLFVGRGSFLTQAFHPDTHELWMRLVIVSIILFFSIYAGWVVARLRRSREKMRQSEEKFRRIVESAEEGIWIVDEFGKTTFINERMAAMLGYASEEIYGRAAAEFLGEGSGLAMCTGVGQCNPGATERCDMKLERKDGSEVWAMFSAAPLFGADGRCMGTLSMVNDITHRKHYEAALVEQRNLAQTYLDVVGVMIVGLDRYGRVSLMNRKGCEVLGYSEEEILGSDWFDDFVPERLKDDMKEFFSRVMSGEAETSPYYENPVVVRGGAERLIAWNNAVLRDAGGVVISTISSGVDITERRKADGVLAERLDELERFRKATVERELRIKELKDRLDGLLKA